MFTCFIVIGQLAASITPLWTGGIISAQSFKTLWPLDLVPVLRVILQQYVILLIFSVILGLWTFS